MGDTPETRYSVQGMKCGGCITKATDALSKLPGYVAAEFDLKTGTAIVKGRIDPQSVVKTLTAVGYPAIPKAT